MEKYLVLITDDDPDFTRGVAKILQSRGAETQIAGSASECLRLMKEREPDVALLDVMLPDQSGVELAKAVKAANADIPVIMVSGYGDTKLIMGAMQAGASDYIPKPIHYERLWEKMLKLLEMRKVKEIEKKFDHLYQYGMILGKSPQRQRLIHEMSRAAHAKTPLLIRGEAGTCKRDVAYLIHSLSSRRNYPFVEIRSSATPELFFEEQIFGREGKSIGKLELAHQGSLFLDEISVYPPELQIKIMRVLQGREFERMGGNETLPIDVRLIVATNRDLEKEIAAGLFREDFYYSLNTAPISVPPLRARREDIPAIAEYSLLHHSRRYGKTFGPLSPDLLSLLVEYDWPGNMTELDHVIEKAVMTSQNGNLSLGRFVSNYSPGISMSSSGGLSLRSLKDLEYRTLVKALEQSQGNISKAAKVLGIGRDTVYRRLRKFGIGLKKNEPVV